MDDQTSADREEPNEGPLKGVEEGVTREQIKRVVKYFGQWPFPMGSLHLPFLDVMKFWPLLKPDEQNRAKQALTWLGQSGIPRGTGGFGAFSSRHISSWMRHFGVGTEVNCIVVVDVIHDLCKDMQMHGAKRQLAVERIQDYARDRRKKETLVVANTEESREAACNETPPDHRPQTNELSGASIQSLANTYQTNNKPNGMRELLTRYGLKIVFSAIAVPPIRSWLIIEPLTLAMVKVAQYAPTELAEMAALFYIQGTRMLNENKWKDNSVEWRNEHPMFNPMIICDDFNFDVAQVLVDQYWGDMQDQGSPWIANALHKMYTVANTVARELLDPCSSLDLQWHKKNDHPSNAETNIEYLAKFTDTDGWRMAIVEELNPQWNRSLHKTRRSEVLTYAKWLSVNPPSPVWCCSTQEKYVTVNV